MSKYLEFSIITITIFSIYTLSADANQADENWNSISEFTKPINSSVNLSQIPKDNTGASQFCQNIANFHSEHNAVKPLGSVPLGSIISPDTSLRFTSFSMTVNSHICDAPNYTDHIFAKSAEKSKRIINVDALDNSNTTLNRKFIPIWIAAPDNFTPQPRVLPPISKPTPKPILKPKPKPTIKSTAPSRPGFALESVQTEFQADINDFQTTQIIEPTFQFRLPNGEKINIKTGFNTFEQPNIERITNIPLQFGWEGKLGKYNIQASAGVDLFDRLPIVPNFHLQIDRPIFTNATSDNKLKSGLFLTGLLEYGAYKPNAKTLENEIKTFHSGLNVYWQIDPNTSFFSLYRLGLYSDDNLEHQSYSRLEHKFGQFWVAANLFYSKYNNNRQDTSGYFSPENFLIYNGEIGWGGDIFSFLNCRLNTTLGRQILNGGTSGGNSYTTNCTAKISPNVDIDFGYTWSAVRNLDTGDTPFSNQTFKSQLQIKF
ncbi:hypothetical protein [Anabaena azotica]|uniref:hypothetical protein n=1 Tax=Anabaena azotica TaxID=197653 RepID=UPI0039A436FC